MRRSLNSTSPKTQGYSLPRAGCQQRTMWQFESDISSVNDLAASLKSELDHSSKTSTHRTTNEHEATNAMTNNDSKGEILQEKVPSPPPPPQTQKEFIFKRMLRTIDNFIHRPFHTQSSLSSIERRSDVHSRGPLLHGTSNYDQHHAVITTALHVFHLYQQGDEITRHSHHEGDVYADDRQRCSAEREGARDERQDGSGKIQYAFDHRARNALRSLGFEFRMNLENDRTATNCKCDGTGRSNECLDCVTRLYHVPSNTAITNENRQTFIADGKMYDIIADLCQAVAQEIMAETCDLVWVTVCDGRGGGLRAQRQGLHAQSRTRSTPTEQMKDPIRALVGRDVDARCPQDTFLVATGKGKVRAGIFSRHHLLTTGLEPSTALPLLYEARNRGMNCVLIDPNARGDGVGMDTFEVSIRSLFEQRRSITQEENEDSDSEGDIETRTTIPADDADGSIYVLAHSAAGGQLVRYLLAQQDGESLLSRIRCITFTDSTHSIQWLKNHPHISSLIESSMALYLRSANPMRDDNWENTSPGDDCPGDHFWSHRFGKTKTVWAGK